MSAGKPAASAQSLSSMYREASRAALLGLVVNSGLGLAKLIGGLVGGSFVLLADAINSFGDSFASLVVLFALRVAQRPADLEHPYGHSRAETIAASNVALMMILSVVWVGWEAIRRLGETHEIPPVWTLWIAGSNMVIKEGLYQYKIRVSRRTGSGAIVANAWDHRSDALCSLAALLGLAAIRWGGPAFASADEIAALMVATAVIWAGAVLFRKSVRELMDEQAEPEVLQAVRQAAAAVPGVHAVEKLWVRKTGLEYLADIHIEVNPQLTVAQGHEISHHVKDHLLAQFPNIRGVLVHLEPGVTQETDKVVKRVHVD